MKIIVLASGSQGNATYIETEHIKLIIDAGISYRQMKLRLQEHNLDIQTIHTVLITHEHSDHIKGLSSLLKFTNAVVYAPLETFEHINAKTAHNIPDERYHEIVLNQAFFLEDLTITPIPVSHDATCTIGFVIQNAVKRLVYMTDIGYLPETDYPLLKNADMYIFEANYDVSLLFSSARPYYLKKRIDSIKGHLSNTDSAYHLTRLIGEQTKTLVLAHPSQECNTEHHVLNTFKEVFESYEMNLDNYDVIVAKQHQVSKIIKL